MKIIIVEENLPIYNISVRNALLYNNVCEHARANVAVMSLPDTALLRKGTPLFVPDTAWPLTARIYAAARICRLGRHIDEKFAHRYYDAVSVAVNFCAEDLLETLKHHGLPLDIARGFDGSIGIGDMIETANYEPCEMTLINDSNEKITLCTKGLKSRLNSHIAFLSKFIKLCHGDVILVGEGSKVIHLETGQTLTGYCEENKCLEIRIK